MMMRLVRMEVPMNHDMMDDMLVFGTETQEIDMSFNDSLFEDAVLVLVLEGLSQDDAEARVANNWNVDGENDLISLIRGE